MGYLRIDEYMSGVFGQLYQEFSPAKEEVACSLYSAIEVPYLSSLYDLLFFCFQIVQAKQLPPSDNERNG